MKRYKTLDREAPEVLTKEKIGRTQALTPEGFLLCSDVPIKRVGEMLYGPGETPIKAGEDGLAHVTRDAAALFSPETIASYQGKPVVDEHPPVDVTPKNWKALSVGITLNPRMGVGDNAGLLVADLLITDADTIKEVLAGKKEVSAGYDADYEQTGPGRGRQTNIIGNHIALVRRGRCGPRCAIGDELPHSLQEKHMPSKTMRRRISDTALAPIRKALRSTFRDMEDQLDQLGNSGLPPGGEPDGDEVDDGADDNHIHIHMHGGQEGGAPAPAGAEGTDVPEDPVEARFQAIEGALSQIMEMLQGGGAQGGAPAGEQVPSVDETPPPDGEGGGDDGGDLDGAGSMEKTEDRATVGDSAALATSWQSLVSDAEILYPGFRVPTHDAKLTRAATIDRMCNIRRQVLDSIYVLPSGKALVDGVTGQTALDTSGMSCGNVAVLFKSAAAVKRSLNNRAGTTDAGHLPASPKPAGATKSIAELNAANKAFWDARKAKV